MAIHLMQWGFPIASFFNFFIAGFTFADFCGKMTMRHKPNNCYLLGETYLDKKVFPSFPYANSGWFVSQQPGKALF